MATYDPIVSPCYVTLEDVKGKINAKGTNDDAMILSFIEGASRRIDIFCRRFFYPLQATFAFDWPGTVFELEVKDDLLSVTTITNGDGNSIPPSTNGVTNYYLYPTNRFPKYKIALGWNSGKVWLFVGTPQQAISIAGIWGYPADRIQGTWNFTTSATVQDPSGQSSSQTTLLVPTGTIRTGQTLYIGSEMELVQSIAGGSTNDTLTVLRGFAGTTAATHANGAAVNRVAYEPDIVKATYRLAAYYYRQKDSQVFDTLNIPMLGQVKIPWELPKDIQEDLAPFVKRRFG